MRQPLASREFSKLASSPTLFMFNLLWKDNRTQVTALRAADHRINPKEQGRVSHALPAAFMHKGRGRIESVQDCG